MGKKKSVVFITLITILLVALLFFSFVPFPISAVGKFNSFVGSSTLGMELGGGVETVYYPEGVISRTEYQEELSKYLAEKEKYDAEIAQNPNTTMPVPVNNAENYVSYKGLYIQKDNLTPNGDVKADFKENFEKAFQVIQRRFEHKLYTNFSIFKQDDYSILVRVPQTNEATNSLFKNMAADGGVQFTNTENTTQNFILNNQANFIRSASVFNAGDSGYGVRINLTGAGREHIKKLTEGASSSTNNNGVNNVGGGNSNAKTVYVYIGTTQLFAVGNITQQLDSSILQVSGSFSSREQADTIVAILNMARNSENTFSMRFTPSTVQTFGATMGQYTALILLLVLAAAAVASIIYMFICHKGLGYVYLLSIVTFILAVVLCTTFIPTLVITPSSFVVIAFAGLLINLFSTMAFKRIKTEFKKGKTLTKSIRDAFNKSAFITAEVHGALFVFATLFYAIATGMMQSVSLLSMLVIALSAAVTLGLNRFYLYLTMPQAKNKIGYCNLRKEVMEFDDEEE